MFEAAYEGTVNVKQLNRQRNAAKSPTNKERTSNESKAQRNNKRQTNLFDYFTQVLPFLFGEAIFVDFMRRFTREIEWLLDSRVRDKIFGDIYSLVSGIALSEMSCAKQSASLFPKGTVVKAAIKWKAPLTSIRSMQSMAVKHEETYTPPIAVWLQQKLLNAHKRKLLEKTHFQSAALSPLTTLLLKQEESVSAARIEHYELNTQQLDETNALLGRFSVELFPKELQLSSASISHEYQKMSRKLKRKDK